MSDVGPAISRFAFARGALRGTHLTLYPTCLVHRSDTHLETLPLAGIAALRVAFERNPRRLGWGVGLMLLALVLLAVASPIDSFASGAVADMAKSEQGVARALHVFFRILVAVASILPVAALACAIGGGALAALGWLGTTTLLVTLPGSERAYTTRGRDTALLDFAEATSERLMVLKR